VSVKNPHGTQRASVCTRHGKHSSGPPEAGEDKCRSTHRSPLVYTRRAELPFPRLHVSTLKVAMDEGAGRAGDCPECLRLPFLPHLTSRPRISRVATSPTAQQQPSARLPLVPDQYYVIGGPLTHVKRANIVRGSSLRKLPPAPVAPVRASVTAVSLQPSSLTATVRRPWRRTLVVV
jgi:hypothetical protein